MRENDKNLGAQILAKRSKQFKGINTKKTACFSFAILALLLFGVACGPELVDKEEKEVVMSIEKGEQASVTSDVPEGAQVYQVRGIVRKTYPGENYIRIQHEEIPGYMAAMTMRFDVLDSNELKGLNPGDAVSFRMIVTEDDGWIDRVKLEQAAEGEASADDISEAGSKGQVLKIGEPFPDCELITSTGSPLNISDFRGSALAVTFIFTRCPFPDFCPRVSKKFNAVQEKMKTSGLADWQMLSISFDPDHDTPEKLLAYSELVGADPDRWKFATGKVEDIRQLGASVGLFFKQTPETIDHNMRTVLVDKSGKIRLLETNNLWDVDDFVRIFKDASKESNG